MRACRLIFVYPVLPTAVSGFMYPRFQIVFTWKESVAYAPRDPHVLVALL
jgi:hypothetical protein